MFASSPPALRRFVAPPMPLDSTRAARRPVFFALAFFVLLTAGWAFWAWRMCDGVWTYAFDDAYIHLAMAHNLAFHGVWGVSAHSFSSASSSPLWTVVLASALRLGNSDFAPFLLNAASGVGVILVAAHLWRGAWGARTFRLRAQTMGLLALCLIAPLALLCFIGMEHSLHALLALMFLGAASRTLAEGKNSRALPILSLLMSAARFEGMFLAGFAALALARQKRWGLAGATLGAALVPLVLHGLMARSQGWPFIAASVAIKGVHPEISPAGMGIFGATIVLKWVQAWGCTAMALCAFGLARSRDLSPSLRAALPIYGATVLAHVALAAVSTFFRYEAYLFVLGVALLWPAFTLALPRARVWRAMPLQLAALFVAAAWTGRAFAALRDGAPATRNIYRQQRQMARFAERFYPSRTIALNDIGTQAWAAANRPDGRAALDLVGLSDREVLLSRLSQPDRAVLSPFARRVIQQRRVPIAIIYDDWFNPDLFGPNWVRVGQWDTGPKIVSAGRRVSFWTAKSNATRLKAQLDAFKPSLPSGVSTLWN